MYAGAETELFQMFGTYRGLIKNTGLLLLFIKYTAVVVYNTIDR